VDQARRPEDPEPEIITVNSTRRGRLAPGLVLSELRVVVLYSLALALERGRPEDRLADEETARVATAIAEALEGRVGATQMVSVWEDLPAALAPFDPASTAVFNLVESLGGRAFTEEQAVRQIEQLGFAHTGASYRALRRSANKLLTKRRLERAGLLTPRYQVFRRSGHHATDLPLPAIVKPIAEGGSFGIRQSSLAGDRQTLQRLIDECLTVYRQAALVEEFIIGREINVALWGNVQPQVLPISEIVFEWTDDPLQQFVTFESKWVAESPEFSGTPGVCPARLIPEEQERVESAARAAYQALEVTGYARVDMRLREGTPYLIEVNANSDLAPDAGFFRSARAAGYSYPEMALHILQLAVDPEP
jgi:D-alanine-D-alanine ligase